MTDILGQAIWDYYDTDTTEQLWVHDHFGPKVEMLVEVYYRDYEEMPELEKMALAQCYGRILDVGAGAGSHAIALEMRGYKCTALDISPLAVRTMLCRGADDAICGDIFQFQPEEQYDTLLLLMNGIGLAGTIAGLRTFLAKAETLLKPDGQIIFDSSDVEYLYEDGEPKPLDTYYGEVTCCYEYKNETSDWFSWLYIDRVVMAGIAKECGWKMQILTEDETGQYLAKLERL